MERVNGATALCFSRGLFPPSLSSQEGGLASKGGGWMEGRIEEGSHPSRGRTSEGPGGLNTQGGAETRW